MKPSSQLPQVTPLRTLPDSDTTYLSLVGTPRWGYWDRWPVFTGLSTRKAWGGGERENQRETQQAPTLEICRVLLDSWQGLINLFMHALFVIPSLILSGGYCKQILILATFWKSYIFARFRNKETSHSSDTDGCSLMTKWLCRVQGGFVGCATGLLRSVFSRHFRKSSVFKMINMNLA